MINTVIDEESSFLNCKSLKANLFGNNVQTDHQILDARTICHLLSLSVSTDFPRWPCPPPQTFRDAGQGQRRRGQETWVQVWTWPLCNLHVTESADKEWRGRIGFCRSLTRLCFYEPCVCSAMSRRWDASQSLGYAIAVRKKCHGPPPRALREHGEFHNWQVLRLTRSSQEWAVKGEFHVAASPFWIANTRKMQIPAGGPLCLTPQGLLPSHWRASLPNHVPLPSANSIQHKNTAWQMESSPSSPSGSECPSNLFHTPGLLRLNCLGLLASGERCPSHPMNSLYRDPSVNATRRERVLKGLGQSVRGTEGVGCGQRVLFFPLYFMSWTGKSSPPCLPALITACIS